MTDYIDDWYCCQKIGSQGARRHQEQGAQIFVEIATFARQWMKCARQKHPRLTKKSIFMERGGQRHSIFKISTWGVDATHKSKGGCNMETTMLWWWGDFGSSMMVKSWNLFISLRIHFHTSWKESYLTPPKNGPQIHVLPRKVRLDPQGYILEAPRRRGYRMEKAPSRFLSEEWRGVINKNWYAANKHEDINWDICYMTSRNKHGDITKTEMGM